MRMVAVMLAGRHNRGHAAHKAARRQRRNQRGSCDATYPDLPAGCIMILTPSIVSSTHNRAINATDVVIAVDVTGPWRSRMRNGSDDKPSD